jgi:NAD(P)-dependent dehydrogenase (short-subunit alcohol dehydrogenase family)
MAERACTRGLNVVLADVNEERLNSVISELPGAEQKRIGVSVEVTEKASVEAMVEKAVSAFGQVHSLVHCAGVARSPTQKGRDGWLPMEEISEADWDFVTEVNLKGTFLVDQAVGRHMLEHGYGRIVNVASISSLVANQKLLGHAPYNAAKAGVVALTKVLAVEWARRGVTVNSISPGYMKTDMGMRSLDYVEGFKEFLYERTAQGRLGEPSEFAAVVDFLTSDDASHITGHNLVMDGGYTAW